MESFHRLIYGAWVGEEDKYEREESKKPKQKKSIELKYPFKQFALPMYGKQDAGDKFIGFEYARIDGLFDNYTHDSDKLILVNSEPRQELMEMFRETWPDLKAKSYALIQNVRVSHHANGVIAYGYWVHTKNDDILDLIAKNINNSKKKMGFISVSHNMVKSTPSEHFYGIILEYLPSCEDGADDCVTLAKKLRKTYEPVEIPSKSKCKERIVELLNNDDFTLGKTPEIVVISTMCYCCT